MLDRGGQRCLVALVLVASILPGCATGPGSESCARQYLLFGMLAGAWKCGKATGSEFEKVTGFPEGDAVIYLYRPAALPMAGVWPGVSVDEVYIGPLKNGGYVPLVVRAGVHRIRVTRGEGALTEWQPSKLELEVSAKAGQSYYVRVLPDVAGATVGNSVYVISNASMVMVPEIEALPEIAHTKLYE